MGPGLFSPEDSLWVDAQPVLLDTSMGPGLFSPEDKSTVHLVVRHVITSMGPGLFSPEDLCTAKPAAAAPALQWGRAYSARRT